MRHQERQTALFRKGVPAPIKSPEATVSGARLAAALPPGVVEPFACHSLPLSKQLSGKKACKETKGLEQGGDTLLFIATVPTHRCQECKGSILSGAWLSSVQSIPSQSWDRQWLHLHPDAGVSALLTSGGLTSFPDAGSVYS